MIDLGQIIVDSLGNNEFNLRVDELNSNAADAIASANFKNSTITLKNITNAVTDVSDPSRDTPIIIEGTWVTPNLEDGDAFSPFENLIVTLKFYVNPIDLESGAFVFTAVTQENWTISDSIVPFKLSVTDNIRFSESPCMVLDTEMFNELGEVQTGIKFSGLMDLAAMTGGLSLLLGTSDPILLSGFIYLSTEGDSLKNLVIRSDNSYNINLGIETRNGRLEIGYDLGSNPVAGYSVTAEPYIKLSTEVVFHANDNEYFIPISVKIANLGSRIRFTAGTIDLIQASIDEFNALVGNTPLANLIPSNFQLDQYLSLADLIVEFDFNSSCLFGVTRISLEVINNKSWTVYSLAESENALSFDEVNLNFMVSSPFDNPNPTFVWSGSFNFFGLTKFVGNGGNPISYFTGSLEKGTDVNSEDLAVVSLHQVADFFLGSTAGLPELAINEFDFQCDLSSGDYSLNVTIVESWTLFPLYISLEEINLQLSYNSFNGLYVKIVASMRIGDISFDITGEHPRVGNAWLFSGDTTYGASINVLDFIVEIEQLFGIENTVIPSFIRDLNITNVGISFNTETYDFTFHAELDITAWNTEIVFTTEIQVTQLSDGAYETTFAGEMNIAGLLFDVVFDTNPEETSFVAVFSNPSAIGIDLSILIKAMLGTDSSLIPEGLTLDLKDAVVGFISEPAQDETEDGTVKFIFALDIGNNINLSNMPLVGQYFSPDQTLELAYQFLITSTQLTAAEINVFNTILPPNTVTFPPLQETDFGDEPSFTISTTMRMGDWQEQYSLPITLNSSTGDIVSTESVITERDVTSAAGIEPLYWNLQKTFGPVYIGRIGVLYTIEENKLKFLIDSSIRGAGLSISVTGLSVSAPLSISADNNYADLLPTFGLDGLGVEFSEAPLELGGAFLQQTKTDEEENAYDEYNGAVKVQFEEFGFSAMGAYANYNGDPSLFVYMLLEIPITIQPYLIITGISGGFGYNRNLIVPSVADVLNFPLVSEILGNSNSSPDLETELNTLGAYTPVAVGEYWAAAGIRFTSFKILDCFALLMIKAGSTLEVDLVGSATLMMPPLSGGLALAEIQIAIDASYRANENTVLLAAQLTNNSFILSRKARLVGGAAMQAWLGGEHEGDFVLSAGGYHPEFVVPAHYPTVPRIGFNLQYDQNLTFKGEMYFALTASAAMTGGTFEASWVSEDIAVWFITHINLIVGWKPIQYQADADVTVGASYTFDTLGIKKTFSYEVGAKLHLFGPELSGNIYIDLHIISFNVPFGNTLPSPPQPISWEEFENSFLPEEWLSVVAVSGLEGENSSGVPIFNSTNFRLEVTSAIPFAAYSSPTNGIGDSSIGISIAPVDLRDVVSNLSISVNQGFVDETDSVTQRAGSFLYEAKSKSIPAALWGDKIVPGLHDDLFIEANTSFIVSSLSTEESEDDLLTVSNADLSFDLHGATAAIDLSIGIAITVLSADDNLKTIDENITTSAITEKRAEMIAAAQISAEVNLSDDFTNQLIGTPVLIYGFNTLTD